MDQFSGIFDHLEPEDFKHDTSSASTGPVMEGDFDAFVQAGVTALRTNFAVMNGKINPFYIVENGNVQRVFTATKGELLGEFIMRVRNETRVISAHRFFFAMETTVGTIRDREPLPVANSPEAHASADPDSWSRRVLYLAAERHDQHQFGVFDIADGLAAEPQIFDQDVPAANLFHPHHAE